MKVSLSFLWQLDEFCELNGVYGGRYFFNSKKFGRCGYSVAVAAKKSRLGRLIMACVSSLLRCFSPPVSCDFGIRKDI